MGYGGGTSDGGGQHSQRLLWVRTKGWEADSPRILGDAPSSWLCITDFSPVFPLWDHVLLVLFGSLPTQGSWRRRAPP